MSLYEFYGETCPHCIEMKPVVAKVEKDLGVTIEKFEVWNSEENAAKMATCDTGLCGGVPFFFNTINKKFICGSTDEVGLKAWAKEE